MAVRVKDVMELDFITANLTLVAGRGGIDKVISYITIMEAPDFYEWVSGGEFVITTWYAFKDHPELQIPSFTAMAERGIAALGIKVNRFIQEVPQEILDLADRFKVPVFAIKRETKFREIVQAVSAELNNYQTNVLLEVERNYRELTKAALDGGDFDILLTPIGAKRNCSCLCLNRDYEVIGVYSPGDKTPPAEEIAAIVRRCYDGQDNAAQYQQFEGLHIFPCIALETVLGFLVLIDKRNLAEKYVLMASQLATFLTLKLLDRIESDQKMLTALFDDMLYKQNLDERELRERLELFGLKLQQMFRIVVVGIDGAVRPNPLQLLRQHGQAVRKIIGEALLVQKPDEVVLIASNQTIDSLAAKPKWLKKLSGYALSCAGEVTVGVGPAVESAKDIRTSYRIAKRTMRAGRCFGQTGVLDYGDYVVHTLLQWGLETPENDFLLNRAIKPLRQYDAECNANLMVTLGAVVFADDLDHAAAALKVHTNTIRYRLGKMEAITGYDFFSAMGRYVLTTAFLLHHYHESGM
ncbi:MAG: PucR family transcriptional regulator ligand-binding domain-containing protein [Negativicutes bacterium]|nr:PucR family transcriptional regulator ligand-binding domain-containing protein [Negativicutes bacterium]